MGHKEGKGDPFHEAAKNKFMPVIASMIQTSSCMKNHHLYGKLLIKMMTFKV